MTCSAMVTRSESRSPAAKILHHSYICFNKIMKDHGSELYALTIDEGIEGYRDESVRNAETLAKDLQIPLLVASYKEFFGFSLDEAMRERDKKGIKTTSCAVCGPLRRRSIDLPQKDWESMWSQLPTTWTIRYRHFTSTCILATPKGSDGSIQHTDLIRVNSNFEGSNRRWRSMKRNWLSSHT